VRPMTGGDAAFEHQDEPSARRLRLLNGNGAHAASDALDVPEFAIELEPHRQTVRVAVTGEIDIATAGKLDAELSRLIRDGFQRVVLDLRDVSFIDSTGVHAILNALRLGEELDVAFALIEVSHEIERVFVVAGIVPRLRFIAPDEIDRPWT
jgi:anti-sigma B factor antagonist